MFIETSAKAGHNVMRENVYYANISSNSTFFSLFRLNLCLERLPNLYLVLMATVKTNKEIKVSKKNKKILGFHVLNKTICL